MSWRPCGRKSGAVRKPPHSGDRKGCVCERAKGAKELETAPQRGVPGAPKAAAWDLRRAEDAKHVLRLRLPPLQRQRRVTYQPGLKGQVMAFKTGKRAEGPKHIGDPTTTTRWSGLSALWDSFLGAGFLGLQPRLVCYAPLAPYRTVVLQAGMSRERAGISGAATSPTNSRPARAPVPHEEAGTR